jgi:hypothetical protein
MAQQSDLLYSNSGTLQNARINPSRMVIIWAKSGENSINIFTAKIEVDLNTATVDVNKFRTPLPIV